MQYSSNSIELLDITYLSFLPLKYLVGRTKYLFKWQIFKEDDIKFSDPVDMELSIIDLFGEEKVKHRSEFFLIFQETENME